MQSARKRGINIFNQIFVLLHLHLLAFFEITVFSILVNLVLISGLAVTEKRKKRFQKTTRKKNQQKIYINKKFRKNKMEISPSDRNGFSIPNL